MAFENGMSVSYTFTGGKEIEEILKTLPENVQREIGLKATKEGLEVIVAEAQSKAPVRTGRTAAAIGIMTAPKSKEIISVDVGVMRGVKRTDKKGAWYAHFVELGTVRRAARPWLRPAFDTKAGEAVQITGQALWKFIEKFLASGRRK